MSATPPVVPLWAEHYIPDFAALLQILERSQNFFLQPVETPSPDLARILADWLRAGGWTVRLVELSDPESWTKLAETLQEPSSDQGEANRAVIVSAPHDLDVEVMRVSMARLNMQRDTIARSLGCPLLWCGTRSFQQLTWEHAPDFWSIASVPYRIALRDLADARQYSPMAMGWWTGAANDDVVALEAAFSRTIDDGSKPAEAARIGLRLAECQLTRGDLGAAIQVLETVRPWLHDEMVPRWRMLLDAVQGESATASHDIIDRLGGQIFEARARGAHRMEAFYRFQLANILCSLLDADMQSQARGELYQARALLAELGDELEVFYVDQRLTSFDLPPAPEMLDAMVKNTEALLEASEDPIVRHDVALVLVQLYRWQQRMQDAERMLDKALSDAGDIHVGSQNYLQALETVAKLTSERGDWSRAYELDTEIINSAQRCELLAEEGAARLRRAHGCNAMKKPFHACVDLLALSGLTWMGSFYDAAFASLRDASVCAIHLGVPQIAAALLLRAARALLHHLSKGRGDVLQFDVSKLRAAGEPEVAERLDDLGRWIRYVKPDLSEAEVHQRLGEFGQEFQRMLDVREAELQSQGIDVMDPLTWGVSEEPPPKSQAG